MLICNNNCNGRAAIYANMSERPIYSTLANSRQSQSQSAVYYFYALCIQRPFDISISNSMKALIMHLCTRIARGSISLYRWYIYTIYGAFICVSWNATGLGFRFWFWFWTAHKPLVECINTYLEGRDQNFWKVCRIFT